MIKRYKFRIFPTEEQEKSLYNHINACRVMWNYMIEQNNILYNNVKKYYSTYDMIKLITPMKKEEKYRWLNEISCKSLQCICKDLGKTYNKAFKHQCNYPKFKTKKRSKNSYPISAQGFKLDKKNKTISVIKVGKIKTNNKILEIPNGKISNPRILKINKKWIITFGVECENQVLNLTSKSMGIDLGVKELAVVAYGDEKLVFHNINKSKRVKKLEKRINFLQRKVSKKYEKNKSYNKTSNIIKYENKLQDAYYELSNIRQNYIHQTTNKLISLKPKRVIMEDLNISGMMKNKHLSKSISDQKLCEFVRQMKYKCEWNGIEFIQVDRFYPSSKLCSCCGNKKIDLKLSDRTYKCDKCGLIIDRDYNAAINLMNYSI